MALKVRPSTSLIHALRAEVPRGQCIYCERLLSGLQKFRCTDDECRRSYYRDYYAGVKLAESVPMSHDASRRGGTRG